MRMLMIMAAVATSGPYCCMGRPPLGARAPVAADTCGASRVGEFIGQEPTEDVLAAVKAKSGASEVRVIAFHAGIPMGHDPRRLNLALDFKGRISARTCA